MTKGYEMRILLASVLFFTFLVLEGCSQPTRVQNSMLSAPSPSNGAKPKESRFNLKFVNSGVFDKTIAMYAQEGADEIDISLIKGVSVNYIPQRLDDILVTAVDNGADLNLVDEKTVDEPLGTRGLPLLITLISAYSNYQQMNDVYSQYSEASAKQKLGNYKINVYYNAESGDISRIKFTLRDKQQ